MLGYNLLMKNTLKNELAVCGFAAVKTLEKINWQRIQRLYFTDERAPLFGGLCKKLCFNKKISCGKKPEFIHVVPQRNAQFLFENS